MWTKVSVIINIINYLKHIHQLSSWSEEPQLTPFAITKPVGFIQMGMWVPWDFRFPQQVPTRDSQTQNSWSLILNINYHDWYFLYQHDGNIISYKLTCAPESIKSRVYTFKEHTPIPLKNSVLHTDWLLSPSYKKYCLNSWVVIQLIFHLYSVMLIGTLHHNHGLISTIKQYVFSSFP